MNKKKKKTFNFFKDETVLSVSLILAFISCFFIKPSMDYFNYINWHTIILLFIIMLVVEVLKNLAVFEIIIRKLLTKINNTRALIFILVFISFFSSIVITNDVALIIFVPFSIMALKKVNRSDLIIIAVSLETIAANVGSMLLPTGSPHNIVLYTMSNISFESFFLILLPYVAVSVIFLLVVLFVIPKNKIRLTRFGNVQVNKKDFFKRVFAGVDYYLLLTFVALFILIGNLENISFFNLLFRNIIVGNEVFCGIIVSQFISNVPSAMLLSQFSSNVESVIIGINIGGFGSLIASMANLISYNIIVHESNEFKRRYLLIFTVLNVLLLFILVGVYFITSCL